MGAQKSSFEWFLLAHFFLKPGIQIAKRYRWGHSLAVRTMKIRNVACGMCHLEGCREITAQDRQFFTIVKAHFRVSGEKETVL